MGMMQEFRDFAVKGNVVDMAVGIIIGAEFGKIVTSMVSDIFMPPIGMLMGKVSFNDLFVNLSGQPVASVVDAKARGLATINYGAFITTAINFIIVAFAVFMMIKLMNRLRAQQVLNPVSGAPAPEMKACPHCLSEVPAAAKACRFCARDI
jgi:large conductance mechanosensitive channel